jgi:hypothetical protein
MKGSSRSGDQTSVQELAMAKALKPSKKIILGSSELSVTEKVSTEKVKISGEKAPSTSAGVGCVGKALKALDLFGSSSSASDDEVAASTPHWKRLRKSAPRRTI